MKRRTTNSLSVHHLSIVFVLLCSVCFIKSSFATDNENQLEAPQDFAITYHEALKYRFDKTLSNPENSTSDTAVQQDQKGSEVLEFEAFGRQFKLLLQPNTELISKLPTKQKSELSKTMQLFRGVIEGVDGSWVRISREGDYLYGMIWDGSEIFVIDQSNQILDALPKDSAPQRSYSLIYRLSDAVTEHKSCGLDNSAKPFNDYSGLVEELKERLQASPQAAKQLDIAIVADTQFTSNNTNPDAAVVSRMNVVDGIYSEQAGVHLKVSEIRSLQNNTGLTSNSPGTLLDQFSRYSESSSFNNPGLAHLFTGRNLNGSTIGIAFLGSLCSDRFGVGISQVGGSGTAGALTVAHEIGHNFGAPHDNQSGSACGSTPQGFIMNPFLDGSDTFSTCSLSQMQPNIQNAACINDIDPTDPTTPQADIGIAFPANPITAKVNQEFSYDIELKNSGTAAANNVLTEISIPAELTAESSSVNGGSCTIATNGLDCNLGDISPNSAKTIAIKILATEVGSFSSSVKVTADNDSNANNNSGNVDINVADTPDTNLIDVNFDSNADGFSYADDTFRDTKQPNYGSGRYRSDKGFSGGGLQVLLGGRDFQNIRNMSGGWQQEFELAQPSRIKVSLRVKLSQARNYEPDEISEALAAIDGTLISSNKEGYLLRVRGDGNGGGIITTGWREISVVTPELAAGKHTLSLGGFNNKKTYRNEVTEVLIDDVALTETTEPDDNTPTAQCPAPAQFATNGKDLNFCWFELSSVPKEAKSYCDYLNSHQTLGYAFDIKLPLVCPSGARATTNGSNLNFCLFEEINIPDGASAQCDDLDSEGRIGYSFPIE